MQKKLKKQENDIFFLKYPKFLKNQTIYNKKDGQKFGNLKKNTYLCT